MSGPGDIFGCVAIQEQCGECDQRPVAVASVPASPTEMDMMWACDDHIGDLVGQVRAQGMDPDQHVFEVSRTCRATGADGAPCGAAGDYLVVKHGGAAVVTVCERHMRAWRPDSRSGEGDSDSGRPKRW
jgi:hypothetical protein